MNPNDACPALAIVALPGQPAPRHVIREDGRCGHCHTRFAGEVTPTPASHEVGALHRRSPFAGRNPVRRVA